MKPKETGPKKQKKLSPTEAFRAAAAQLAEVAQAAAVPAARLVTVAHLAVVATVDALAPPPRGAPARRAHARAAWFRCRSVAAAKARLD